MVLARQKANRPVGTIRCTLAMHEKPSPATKPLIWPHAGRGAPDAVDAGADAGIFCRDREAGPRDQSVLP